MSQMKNENEKKSGHEMWQDLEDQFHQDRNENFLNEKQLLFSCPHCFEQDETEGHICEGHGNHWSAVIPGFEEDIKNVLRKSLEKGRLVGTKRGRQLISCSFKENQGEENPLSVKSILSIEDDSVEVLSGYPCVTTGTYVHMQIEKINEWKNGLEAIIQGKTDSGTAVSFFDTDYFLHKNEYEEGESYWFSLAGIIYSAEMLEKKAADFEREGEKAIDFKQKEYSDDASFLSPLNGGKVISKFFGTKLVSGYKITLDALEDITIPVVIAQNNLEGKPRVHKECRGVLWLHGHFIPNEEIERFHKFKQWILEHLDGLLTGELSEEDFEKEQIKTDDDKLNEYMDSYDSWHDLSYDDESHTSRVVFTYDRVPFNMIGTFKSFEFWDKDLIMTCVQFKKKYDKWPTAIVTNEATYKRWEEAIHSQLEEPGVDDEDSEEKVPVEGGGYLQFDEESDVDDSVESDEDLEFYEESEKNDSTELDDDYVFEELLECLNDPNGRIDLSGAYSSDYWDNFDTSVPLDEIKPEGVPIEFGEDFATPFFRLTLLVDNTYAEGIFRLMYGEGPGTDDGEEIPEDTAKSA